MPRPKTRNPVTIPILNDLIFTLLYNSTMSQRMGLPEKFLRMLRSERQTRRFAVNSTREEKELVLAHFGMRFFYVLISKDVRSVAGLKEMFDEFAKENHSINEPIYVHGDEQLAYHMALYAKGIHHPNYFLNYEIMRAGYHIKNWKKTNQDPEQMEVRETLEADGVLLKTMLSANVMAQMFPSTGSISQQQLLVLLYLSVKKYSYVEKEKIWDFFKGYVPFRRKEYVRNILRQLQNEKLAQKNPAENAYSITSLGVKKISEFRDSVLSFNNFY